MKQTDYQYVQNLRKRKNAIVQEHKQRHGCQRCGETHPAVLDLHHKDIADKHPRLKRKNTTGNKRTGGYFWRDLSYKDLRGELTKCEVLCSNCHRKETYEQRANGHFDTIKLPENLTLF